MPKNPDPLSSRSRLVAGSQLLSQLLGSFLSRRRRPRSVVRRPASQRKQCCQIAAITALSRYSVAGFGENAIATASRCGFRENSDPRSLTRRETTLGRGCCVVVFRQG
ncbi:hypothetical protein HKD37_08G021731 [Glycine soja]